MHVTHTGETFHDEDAMRCLYIYAKVHRLVCRHIDPLFNYEPSEHVLDFYNVLYITRTPPPLPFPPLS